MSASAKFWGALTRTQIDARLLRLLIIGSPKNRRKHVYTKAYILTISEIIIKHQKEKSNIKSQELQPHNKGKLKCRFYNAYDIQ